MRSQYIARIDRLLRLRQQISPEEVARAIRLTCETGVLPPESMPELRELVQGWRLVMTAIHYELGRDGVSRELDFMPTPEEWEQVEQELA